MRFFDGPDTVRRARRGLDESGFTHDALTERFGVHAFAHLAHGELAPLVRATRAGDRLDTVLRLFVAGLPVSRAEAQAALAPSSLEQWIAGGVLTADDREVSSRIAIRPVGGDTNWLVCHDFARRHGDFAIAGATI